MQYLIIAAHSDIEAFITATWNTNTHTHTQKQNKNILN